MEELEEEVNGTAEGDAESPVEQTEQTVMPVLLLGVRDLSLGLVIGSGLLGGWLD